MRRFLHSVSRKAFVLGVLAASQSLGTSWAQSPKTEAKVPDKTNPSYLQVFKPAVKNASTATVKVLCLGKEVALGTIVDASGLVLTKASEVKFPPKCRLPDGRELEAEVVGVEEKHDLMLLRIPQSGLKAVTLLASAQQGATAGKWVVSPGGTDGNPLAVGVVSVPARTIEQSFLQRITANTNHGFMGVTPVLNSDKGGGVVLEEVDPLGAASKAGIKAGDMIVQIKGKRIQNSDEMLTLMRTTRPGEVIEVKVRRSEKEMEFRITLGKRPTGNLRGEMQNKMGGELSERRSFFPTILQHDTILKPHECGGPLCDLEGNCIGINIARAGRVESYALPVEVVIRLIEELKAGKHPFSGQFSGELLVKEEIKSLEEEKAKAEKAIADADAKVKEAKEKLEAAEKGRKEAEQKKKEKLEQLEKAKQREVEIQKLKQKNNSKPVSAGME